MKKSTLVVVLVACIIIIASVAGWFQFEQKKQAATMQKLEQFQANFNNGDFDQGISQAEQSLNKNAKDVDALLALAALYAQRGSISFSEEDNAKQAIEYAQKALAIDPQNSEAYRMIGYAYEIQEQYDLAIQNYDKSLELNPSNSLTLGNKGHAYDLQGNMSKAEQYYKEALKINPTNEHALLNIARLAIRNQKFDQAQGYIDTLVHSSKNKSFLANGYQLSAEIFRSTGDYDNAEVAIAQSIEFDARQPQAWVTRGRIEMMNLLLAEDDQELKASLDRARGYANKAIEINENQTTAYMLLADLEIPEGDTKKQAEYIGRARQVVDTDITLGVVEKNSVKQYLDAKIKVN